MNVNGNEQSEGAPKRTKMEKLLMNKKTDANEGDVENFYSNDPSKAIKVSINV